MSVSDSEVAAALEMLRANGYNYLAALLEAQQAECERLREVLEWLDRRGGLGVKVHEHIEAALMQVIAAPVKAAE
jgi:hypothetical protein